MANPSHTPKTPDYAVTHPHAYGIGEEVGRSAALFAGIYALNTTKPIAIEILNLEAAQSLAGDVAVMELVGDSGDTMDYDGQYLAAAVTGARQAVRATFEEMGVAA